jgi:hypothetical protein
MEKISGVYLLHFERKFGSADRCAGYKPHAGHYIGYADDVERRVNEHAAGQGASLTRALYKAGIGFEVAYFWEGADRNFERWLKDKKSAPRFCPICQMTHGERERMIYDPVPETSIDDYMGKIADRLLIDSHQLGLWVSMRFDELVAREGVAAATRSILLTLGR